MTFLAFILCAFPAFAEITGIKVLSFKAIGNYPYDKSSEICGFANFTDEKLVQILITVVPKGNPASYSTLADPKVNFCAVVATYTGQASVSAVSQISGTSMATPELHQLTFGATR